LISMFRGHKFCEYGTFTEITWNIKSRKKFFIGMAFRTFGLLIETIILFLYSDQIRKPKSLYCVTAFIYVVRDVSCVWTHSPSLHSATRMANFIIDLNLVSLVRFLEK